MAGAKTLSERDIRRALTHCQMRRHSQRDQTLIHMSTLAGLRACEMAALLVSDVYAADGSVRSSFTLSHSQTKGHRSRTVYVSRKLARVLSDYWQVVGDRADNKPLFMSQRGTAFSANTLSQLFLEIYHAVGLRGCSSHSGRKTFITRLADQGVAVHVLAALAGHRHIGTTQRYITVNEAMLERAVELA